MTGNVIESYMQLSDWTTRWEEGRIGFHLCEHNEFLVKHIDKLLQGRSNVRIFFPLCGKAVDMKWLYDEGHTIVGLEASAKGIEDFFNENGLKFVTESVADSKFTLYKTEDNRLLIYCGDMYEFNSALGGKMQGIWDRGSLVAINKEDRNKYVDIMVELMGKDCFYLLDTFEFNDKEYAGPPHPVPQGDVKHLYGSRCNIELLEKKDSLGEKQKGWGLTEFWEFISLLTLK